jgi:hypothetical protein
MDALAHIPPIDRSPCRAQTPLAGGIPVTPEEYLKEVYLRTGLKVGMGIGIPLVILLLVNWRRAWPYATAIAVLILWVVLIDQAVDRYRNRRERKALETRAGQQ